MAERTKRRTPLRRRSTDRTRLTVGVAALLVAAGAERARAQADVAAASRAPAALPNPPRVPLVFMDSSRADSARTAALVRTTWNARGLRVVSPAGTRTRRGSRPTGRSGR